MLITMSDLHVHADLGIKMLAIRNNYFILHKRFHDNTGTTRNLHAESITYNYIISDNAGIE